ncbi:molybdopterin guanine dinucleotide biosynthesis accessory protein MobB [Hoeflea halophila]|uniref:Molybdopterin guanine dinucleotide biosynthesis accessory protein MobB n=1 Tax=Hoeflea halophila TaxID=714899 RepID=A0A286IE77_9HYPH|nr:molybdopterin-guanine dinucleotide biosynthesis protein B [Hoeflea halophila]SOE18420.1 molybdopterin guanine dinucleotide biosynthesis accessory protein MobB [Hoeflea halophila]
MTLRVFGITGWKNSGKTTLTCKLVEEFTRRGFRVSTLKHAHHAFDVDHEGTDSYRHRQAGAGEVAIVSGRRWAVMHELKDRPEPSMQEMLAQLSPCDLVLIEGFKRANHPKIELRREAALDRTPVPDEGGSIRAIAADHAVDDAKVPVFSLEDIAAIADMIALETGLGEPAA